MLRALLLNLCLLLSIIASACECPPLAPLNKDAVAGYDAIFSGRVDSVSACRTDGIATAFFTINELYKGTLPQSCKVDFECSSACLMSFAKGEEWIIYAAYLRFDLLKTELCSHSRKSFPDSNADIYFMATQRTFGDEQAYLRKMLGTKAFLATEDNEHNRQQAEMKPHNDQPSGTGKIILLAISCAAMLIVYYFANKKRKQ